MRVLLVKMSSLGDVVHTLAAITDAAQTSSQIQFDWVIEESYREIARWHPAVRRVIPIALRRWRYALWPMIRDREWFRFRADLRQDTYDLVLDAQGLFKSAFVGFQARGPLAGRNRSSAREPMATLFYRRRFNVDLTLPEVEQLRQLFGLALGYDFRRGPAQFGIDAGRVLGPTGRADVPRYVVLAHGAAWPSKLWPLDHWQRLARELAGRGWEVKLPWGNENEKSRAGLIAQDSGAQVLPQLGIRELAQLLAGADLIVGLDTGLTHIGIALGTPTITLYGPSVPVYGEVAGDRLIHLASSDSRIVDTARLNTVALSEVIRAVDSLTREPRSLCRSSSK